jgi:chromosomal replication initiator protein
MEASERLGATVSGANLLEGQWKKVRGLLRAEVGEAAYRSWLRPMTVSGHHDDLLIMTVPTRFMRDWVMARYEDRLRALWGGENPTIRRINIVVQQDQKTWPRVDCHADQTPTKHNLGVQVRDEKFVQDGGRAGIAAPLDRRFTFENFVTGKSNEFAYAAAQRVAEAVDPPFNPLFLYGGVGLGKTHLMHAIAWDIQRHYQQRSVLYLSAEKFMYRFIRALREQKTVDFKEQFRSVDVLMIDDVQFISGKESTQEEFFHTFNTLVDQGRQIVLSADKSPSDLEGMQERLKSRLNCGLVADIHATTYELRLGILQSKAEQMGVQVSNKVMEFLAHRITANIRELEGALNRVVAHAQLVGRTVSLETTQEVLHDLLRANDRRITIDDIQKNVAAHFNIRVADMSSARRARSVARPRQVAMYLAKQLTSRSLPEIGRRFGGRDHTTVMHAVRKVEEICQQDSAFAEDLELLRRMLQGG